MANPFSSAAKASGKVKMRALGGRSSDAAQDKGLIKRAIGAHDSQLHGGKHTDLKPAGFKSGGRLDKPRRDKGGVHKRTKLNVSAPQDIVPPPPMAAASQAAPPMPPMMQKHGGRTKKASGGRLTAGMDSGVGRLQLSHKQKQA